MAPVVPEILSRSGFVLEFEDDFAGPTLDGGRRAQGGLPKVVEIDWVRGYGLPT